MIQIAISKKLNGADGDMMLTLDTAMQRGDFIALNGKSGSGKTTLLRILAGLEEAQGSIEVEGVTWLDKKINLPPQKRGIGFVFQDYALFDNMNVKQNLLYVNNDRALADKLLNLTDLGGLKDRSTQKLSGGQKQRVALCRAMMNSPKLLLMDEPLSALDPSMRARLQDEILLLHKEFGTTTIMVSHEPSEIYKLASRVIVLENGKLLKEGTPKDVLLKRSGSQKFSFEGEIIDMIQADIISVAIISIGQQLVEVVLSAHEKEKFKIGDRVNVSTKAFGVNIAKGGGR
ncbi:MAG: ATP-binding cassette domain-containing protein [Sulfurovaceae bacterium]